MLNSIPHSSCHMLAVVIVCYNSADVLPGLLDSIAAGLRGIDAYEVVIVDNDSADNCVEIARRHPVVTRIVETGRNGGYSAAINAATSTIADNADLLVLNPDIRLLPDSMVRLRAALLKSARPGIAVPTIFDETGHVSRSIRREPSLAGAWSEAVIGGRLAGRVGLGDTVCDDALYRNGGAIDWATGAILMIASGARAQIGDWDESFFLYSEEVDYFRRARTGGFDVIYVPEAKAVHIGGDYQSSRFLSNLMMANAIKYYRRHHGRIATLAFRAGLIIGQCLRTAMRRSGPSALPAALGIWHGWPEKKAQ